MRPTFCFSGACLGLLLAVAPATIGCGDSGDDDGGGTGATGPSSTGTGTAGSGGTGATGGGAGATGGTGGGTGGGEACGSIGSDRCPGPGFNGSDPKLVPDLAQGTVLDDEGNPVAMQEVQLCGINLCLYGTTNAQGVGIVTGTGQELHKPVFKYGNGLTHAKLGVPVTEPSTMLGNLVTAKLPDSGPQLVPGTSVTSGDVTLTIAEGATITIDELIYEDCESQQFRAARIPLDPTAPAVDPRLGLELFYGVGPVETLFCPAAQVTVPNTPGWPADSDVEFYVQGLAIGQEYAEYGGWTKASDGKVSSDGATISTVPNGGLLELTTFAIRLKP